MRSAIGLEQAELDGPIDDRGPALHSELVPDRGQVVPHVIDADQAAAAIDTIARWLSSWPTPDDEPIAGRR